MSAREPAFRDLPSADERMKRLEDAAEHRVVVEQTRMEGKKPLTVVVVGSRKIAKATTGTIAAGASETIYLTYNREVGGESLFMIQPQVTLLQDEDDTPGGLARASGPADPTKDLNLVSPSSASARLSWLGAIGRWAVRVTNEDVYPHCYHVHAEGP